MGDTNHERVWHRSAVSLAMERTEHFIESAERGRGVRLSLVSHMTGTTVMTVDMMRHGDSVVMAVSDAESGSVCMEEAHENGLGLHGCLERVRAEAQRLTSVPSSDRTEELTRVIALLVRNDPDAAATALAALLSAPVPAERIDAVMQDLERAAFPATPGM